MSHLVSEYSQVGGSIKTQPHAGVKMTMMDAENSFEDIIQAVALPTGVNGLAQAGQVITFISAQTSQYTDLKKSYVRIRGTWTNGDNSAIAGTEACSVAVGFPNCLFDDVGLYLNGSTISPNRTGDPWIAFVDRLLLKRKGQFGNSNSTYFGELTVNAGTFQLDQPAFEIDESENLDMLDSVGAGINSSAGLGGASQVYHSPIFNAGATKRTQTIVENTQLADDGVFEYIYQPNVGAWCMDKYLPDRIEVKLLLRIASPAFYCFGGTAATDSTQYQFTITNIELVMHRVELRPEIVQQNALAISQRPWIASTYQWIYNRLSATNQNFDLTSVYQGVRPKFCLVAFADSGSVGTSYNYNPYYMAEGDVGSWAAAGNASKSNYVNQIFILVNGKQYPIRQPYNPSGVLGHIRDYRALCSSMADGFPEVSGNLINYKQYCTNYTWYCFQIDPLEGENDEYALSGQVQIEIHGTFSVQPQAPQICHFLAYVDATLEVDMNRSCQIKMK